MLTDHIDRYVALRQALGYRLRKTARHLHAFARFADAKGDTHIRTSTAVAWATDAPSPSARHIRLRDVVHLARFLHAEDAAHEVPPATLFPAPKMRPLPYIYPPGEVAQIVAAAGRLRRTYPLRREVYTTLFGLIAATGLRVSEALDLRFDDLQPNGVLLIRRTKFGKSRLVPLHPTVAEALDRYLDRRRKLAVTDDHVFLSASDRRIGASMVNYTIHFAAWCGSRGSLPSGPGHAGFMILGTHLQRDRCNNARPVANPPRVTASRWRPTWDTRHRPYLLVFGGDAGVDDRYRHRGRSPDGRGEQPMTPIAPLITAFLREHMPIERGYSPQTCETYAYAFRLLFLFASERLKQQPSQLCLEHIDAALVLSFLTHIEQNRSNGATSRNSRLATIKAFMRYVEFRVPSALDQIRQIHAIPTKRHDQALVRHLTMDEVRAILDAPNLTTRLGIRDRAMLHVCFACGLRVSELVGLQLEQVSLHRPASIRVRGKGRKERSLPLWKETTTDLRAWLAVRGTVRVPEVFVNAEGAAITRAGFEYILDKHTRAGAAGCPGLVGRSVSPHQLRHSCAVIMLQATRDIRKVALWLGHADVRTTEIYLRLDPSEKLEAVEAVLPPTLRRGQFKAPDALIASLFAPVATEQVTETRPHEASPAPRDYA